MSTTTVPPTTTIAPTTAPPSTTVEDQLTLAIERAQTAERNCYKAVPQPCDMNELEAAFVGAQLERTAEVQDIIVSIEGENELVWTIKEGPRLKAENLGVATICRFDPQVVTYADGNINAEANYFLQEWSLVAVGNAWKVTNVINLKDGTTDPAVCDV